MLDQVLSKTLDSTALTPEKVELATLTHDAEADVVSGFQTCKSCQILLRFCQMCVSIILCCFRRWYTMCLMRQSSSPCWTPQMQLLLRRKRKPLDAKRSYRKQVCVPYQELFLRVLDVQLTILTNINSEKEPQ